MLFIQKTTIILSRLNNLFISHLPYFNLNRVNTKIKAE